VPCPRPWSPLIALLLACLLAAGAAAGEITYRSVPSATLGAPIPYALYRPDGVAPDRRLPVLYLLHGLGDDERAWPTLGHIGPTLDALIAEGALPPLLVVMPAAGRTWYVDGVEGQPRYNTAFFKDFMPAVERSLSALSCREARATAGLSMGGYGALLFAFQRSDLFGAAISLSGSIFQPAPADPAERAKRQTRMFGDVFGTPFDWRAFQTWNLFPRIADFTALADPPALYLAVGDKDFPGLIRGNELFQAALAAAGVRVTLHVDPGSHTWPLWTAQIGPALAWLGQRLATGCRSGTECTSTTGGKEDRSGITALKLC